MRIPLLFLLLLAAPACRPQRIDPSAPPAPPAGEAPGRTDFRIKYVNGTSVYIDGGSSSGLAEGTQLILKETTHLSPSDPANKAIEPGIIARLTVTSVASTSAVCEIVAKTRDLTDQDVVSLPESEIKELIDKDARGSSRHYPMVLSFSGDGDPLDEEVRDDIPRPPLPEVNQMRGRFGFTMSTIQQLGPGGSDSTEYGMIVRADFTRIFGTHWNLVGYWRGTLQQTPAGQQSIQDLMNRTYLMSLSYINPQSPWTASFGRMYLPYAASLETIDGGFVGWKPAGKALIGGFFGSSPDPTAWNYNPDRELTGVFFNIHAGSFEDLHYSATVGGGLDMIKWSVDRPFLFTESDFSYKRYVSVFHSMQVDEPKSNPGQPAVGWGLGQSLLTVRVQVHPRVDLDFSHTYFRDVPTYDAVLVGTGLLDKYLYQGLNGGVRVRFPLHVTGYGSIGRSNNSNDAKSSLNEQLGAAITNVWKSGLSFDARYSKFDSGFASGTYKSLSVMRDLGERFRLDLQGGRYDYNSSLAATSDSYFINSMFDMNLGARLFLQSAFTTQRGGTFDYNQWTNTLGYRFDNRAAIRAAQSHQQ